MLASLVQSAFWLSQLAEVGGLVLIAYASGRLALRGVRVNYTRKIVHFALFFLPMLLADVFPFERSLGTTIASGAVFAAFLAVMVRPVRQRSGFVATLFASFDRPEDRPHTLLWLTSQVAAGYAVLLPLAAAFDSLGMYQLIYIPLLINGLGDGLAEPVGVRFGRHEYRVGALFSDRTYVRTLEGSACVLLAGVAVVVRLQDLFTPVQFWTALAVVPPIMTLAEARSPHTWDTPFLFLAGGLSVLAIVYWL